MSAESVFFDTNILVYANDLSAGAKRDIARNLLVDSFKTGTGVLSTQVLAEFWVTVTKKLPRILEPELAERQLALFSAFTVVGIDLGIMLDAVKLQGRYQLSFWDAQIVSAASHAGCGILLSEDMRDGAEYGTIRVQNPFRTLIARAADPGESP